MTQELNDIQQVVSIPGGNKKLIGRKSSRRTVIAARLAICVVLLLTVAIATILGLRVRSWAWVNTAEIHFYPDMQNGIHWGGEAGQPASNPCGFWNVYDRVAATPEKAQDANPNYGLDYAPLRLAVMTRWVRWAKTDYSPQLQQAAVLRDHNPGGAFDSSPAMYAPLLKFNDAMELAAALGIFCLTRHWVIRGDRRVGSMCRAGTWGAVIRPFRGCFAGGIAMALFWFSPAVIVSAHGWPTWDEWIIPFFVWAIFFACTEWWFAAGVVIAVGAMFKGQQLFVAPLFLLWPLLLGKWESALRWAAGLVLTVALLASPWLLTYSSDLTTRRVDVAGVICVIITFALLAAGPAAWQLVQRRRGVLQPVNLLANPLYRIGAALLFGIVLFAAAGEFHGSFAWMVVGWGYGTRHYLNMVVGFSDNLAGLLAERYGWGKGAMGLQETVMTFAAHPLRLWPTHAVWFATPTDVSIRALLISLYVVAFLTCVVGMAVQSKRNDPNFLVAMTGVWLVFFALMPQIHERYLLYAACVGCSLTAVGVGFTLLNLFLTLLTFVMTTHVMLSNARGVPLRNWGMFVSNTFGASCLHFCRATFPDAGWAVLLTVAIFLFFSFRRSPVKTITVKTIMEKFRNPGEENQLPAQLYGQQHGDAAGGGI